MLLLFDAHGMFQNHHVKAANCSMLSSRANTAMESPGIMANGFLSTAKAFDPGHLNHRPPDLGAKE
jgi:hypothetical protein